MVNLFQRLTRRALSSSNTSAESKSNEPNTGTSHDLHRTTSVSSKRSRDVAAQEPIPRHLILISDTPEFDPEILRRFRAEAFEVEYLHFTCSGDFERDRRALENAVHEKEDDLEAGERFAIVETCVPACSDTEHIFQSGPAATLLPIQIHIPEPENGCTFWPWITLSPSEGDVTYKKRHRCYVFKYPHSQTSLKDGDSLYEGKDGSGNEKQGGRYIYETDPGSGLAWSRTLGCLRRAFGAGSNWPVSAIETVWDEYWQSILAELDHGKEPQRSEDSWSAMEIMSGRRDLQDEYGISIECVPTKAGAEIPWLLPGISATNREIEVSLVIVARFSADRIVHQRIYWDQADVLVQAGILDSAIIPRAHV
ncbi:hypothetical protein N7488_003643 [Penicillium malachiteum]|nr:hypothetical protein N7488_003643 [Penicillium malachiteum]